MKVVSAGLFILFSLYYAITSNAAPISAVKSAKTNTANARKSSARVSKSLYAKLKAQALNEARAELLEEQEQRERAKLEALEELSAETEEPGHETDSTGN